MIEIKLTLEEIDLIYGVLVQKEHAIDSHSECLEKVIDLKNKMFEISNKIDLRQPMS